MYRVEIASDKLQQAAVDRRRRLDEERKNRLFDPKARIIGIDVKALEDQIKIKNEIKDWEKLRDDSFNNQMSDTNKLLMHLDHQMANQHRNNSKNLEDFRAEKQKVHERRDFDLYDPNALKKDLPGRVGDFDERLKHQSNLQKFEGEDLKSTERSLEQKQQMKTWSIQGMYERELKKKQEEKEKKEFEEYQEIVAAKSRALQRAMDKQKADTAKNDFLFNQKLSEEKRKKEEEFKLNETEKNFQEIIGQVNGEILTENPDSFNIGGGHKVRVDVFKGFNNYQKHEVLVVQDYQRREVEARRQHEREVELEWAYKQEVLNRASILMEQDSEKKRRELAIKIRKENELKAKEEKER
ncbi:Protein Tax-1 [Lobulomyces angularis]|nr:Protein Tax-1 [Lobulomyces angularis]